MHNTSVGKHGPVTVARRVFWGYAALILYLTTYPWRFHLTAKGQMLAWTLAPGRASLIDLILNFGLLVPLGFLGAGAFAGKRGKLLVLGCIVLLASLAEGLQACIPNRVSSASDLLANVAGGAAGLFLGSVFPRQLQAVLGVLGRRQIDVRALVLLVFFAVGKLFPFIPSYRLPHLRGVWENLFSTAPPMMLFTAMVTMLFVAVLLRLAFRPALPSSAAFLFVVGILLVSVFFPRATPSGHLLAASLLGGLAGSTIPDVLIRRWLPLLAIVYLVVRQTSPFQFAVDAQPFSLAPFESLMQLSHTAAMRFLFEKLFVYGACVYFIHRSLGLLVPSALLVAILLALGEFLQMWIPGRTPESLDPLLALLAAAIFRALPSKDTGSIYAGH